MSTPTDPKSQMTLSTSLARALPENANIGKLNELAHAYIKRIEGPKLFKNQRLDKLIKSNDQFNLNVNQNLRYVDKINQMSASLASLKIPFEDQNKLPLSRLTDTSKLLQKISNLKTHTEGSHLKKLLNSNISVSANSNRNLKQINDALAKYNKASLVFSGISTFPRPDILDSLNQIDSKANIHESSYSEGVTAQPPSNHGLILNSEVGYGTKIKEIRKLQKLSQEKLAMLAGISVVSIKNIERGIGNPSLKTILKINDVLNINLALV